MLVACIQTIVDAEKNRRDRPAHLEYIFALRAEGKVHEGGRFADGSGGMVVYRVDSLEEARRLAEADPIVAGGARTYVLHEWVTIDWEHPETYR